MIKVEKKIPYIINFQFFYDITHLKIIYSQINILNFNLLIYIIFDPINFQVHQHKRFNLNHTYFKFKKLEFFNNYQHKANANKNI